MALTDSIIHHWKLDEASGNDRADEVGSATLEEQAIGVLRDPGQIDNAAQGTGADYLRVAATTVCDFTTENFTIAFWLRPTAFPASQGVMLSKWNSSGRQFQCDYLTADQRFRFFVRNAADDGNFRVNADNLGAPSTDTWYFIQLRRDADNEEISIRVNNGTANTLAHNEDLPSQTTRFAIIKRDGDPTTLQDTVDGLWDELSVWERVLSDSELDEIYNLGNGLAYPWASEEVGSSDEDGSLRAGGTSRIFLPPFHNIP